jgi:hypothetical protein
MRLEEWAAAMLGTMLRTMDPAEIEHSVQEQRRESNRDVVAVRTWRAEVKAARAAGTTQPPHPLYDPRSHGLRHVAGGTDLLAFRAFNQPVADAGGK